MSVGDPKKKYTCFEKIGQGLVHASSLSYIFPYAKKETRLSSFAEKTVGDDLESFILFDSGFLVGFFCWLFWWVPPPPSLLPFLAKS